MPEKVNTSALADVDKHINDDSQKTMVKIDHVSMIFNMASEQLNSLKEYAIKLARRELFFEGFTALDDISFEVKKGDVFGIIGTNGSGKSTLLKIVAGVLEPTKGSCEINGNIAPLIELGAGFDSELSARENIYLNGALLGYSKGFIKDHFDEIVDFAEIESFLDMPLKNYSSGMVARIAFAIATVIVPEILVVDEVLSVGDFMFQKKCEDRINELIDKHGVTVLIVSHSNEQIKRLCNKAIWIEKGHTRLLGKASTVCRVYDGLGGRTGSAQAEQRVFEALIQDEEHDSEDFTEISEDNIYGTAVKLATRGWEDGFDSAFIVESSTHANTILASGLAGALKAPILPIKSGIIPDSILAFLHEKQPSQIFFVDCGHCDHELVTQLEKLSWQPKVIQFTGSGDTLELSEKILLYGLEQQIWENTAMLIDFDDNSEAFSAAPLASFMRTPVIITMGEVDIDRLRKLLVKTDCQNILLIGKGIEAKVKDKLDLGCFRIDCIANSSLQNSCLDICRHTLNYLIENNQSPNEVCVGSLSLSHWQELIGCGAYAAQRKALLLLQNENDLDDVAACLDFIKEETKKTKEISFIGKESGLSRLDRELLLEAFEIHHPKFKGIQKRSSN